MSYSRFLSCSFCDVIATTSGKEEAAAGADGRGSGAQGTCGPAWAGRGQGAGMLPDPRTDAWLQSLCEDESGSTSRAEATGWQDQARRGAAQGTSREPRPGAGGRSGVRALLRRALNNRHYFKITVCMSNRIRIGLCTEKTLYCSMFQRTDIALI